MRAALLGLALGIGAAAQAAPPPPGRYSAELCVATQPGRAPGCGPADVALREGGRLEVRVADVVYRLALHRAELDVTTMHGSMQIDEFSSPYAWQGTVLQFVDAAKSVVYEVRVGAPKAAFR